MADLLQGKKQCVVNDDASIEGFMVVWKKAPITHGRRDARWLCRSLACSLSLFASWNGELALGLPFWFYLP